VFRVGVVNCHLEESFLFDTSFKVLKGEEFFKDGVLNFSPVVYRDGTYRTVFGPSFPHDACIYANNNHNANLSGRRLYGKRFPDEPGKHELYMQKQHTFTAQHAHIIDQLRTKYSSYFTEFTDLERLAEAYHADPHPKKHLRVMAWMELHLTSERYEHLWLRQILYKIKKGEWAKPGKKPRGIGDLGVSASLQGAWITELLKTAMSKEPLAYLGGKIEFCKKPDRTTLRDVFRQIMQPEGRFYFVYFSDDSVLSYRINGKVYRWNLDISSCDSSHGRSVFHALVGLVPKKVQPYMKTLVDQLSTPILIRSQGNSSETVKLKPSEPHLASGSTITTAINNLACIFICISITSSINRNNDFSPQSLVDAAANCGYKITGTEPLELFEDVQFLKHSPVLDSLGHWEPVLNLGVLLRASGTCNGDLPGRGDLEIRAREFQFGLLRGMYPRTNTILLDNMRRSTGITKVSDKVEATIKQMLAYKVYTDENDTHITIEDENFYRRYRLTGPEIQSLNTHAGSLCYQESFHCTAVEKILACDYELGVRDTRSEPFDYLHLD